MQNVLLRLIPSTASLQEIWMDSLALCAVYTRMNKMLLEKALSSDPELLQFRPAT